MAITQKSRFYALVVFCVAVFGFFSFSIIQAQDESEPCLVDPCPMFHHFECPEDCGSNFIKYFAETCCNSINDGKPYEVERTKCEAWQKCLLPDAQGGYQLKEIAERVYDWDYDKNSPVGCTCGSQCLEKPKNPRYYDNPTYSDQPDKDTGNKNVKLPVKLDWDDVPGWQNKGGPKGKHKQDPFGPTTYKISLSNIRNAPSASESYTKVLDKSEFNSVTDGMACLLKSASEVPWSVQACCDREGKDCGEKSKWDFTTDGSPEPKEPYDPDWTGKKGAEKVPAFSATLKWCKVDGATSYEVLVYVVDKNGGEKCHPNLLASNKTDCIPYEVGTDIGASGQEPPTEISNAEMGLMTKNNSYAWKVNACGVNSKGKCSDWSQKWKLGLEDFNLGAPQLVSPPDDPQGEVPVGLPVKFSWKGTPGTLSYVIEITGANLSDKDKKTTVSSKVLDHPTLEIDKIYQWRVKPCWDTESENCENLWSKTFTFRTTGRPPKTMKPEGTVSMPVDFEWEDVPGAKSFIFKLQGSGTNIEKTLDKAEIGSAEVSGLKQEKTYTWRVKTCAREGGQLCGDWSGAKSITISKLNAPANPNPPDGAEIDTGKMPMTFSWSKVDGAGAYKIKINYVSKAAEETGNCPTGKLLEKIVEVPSHTVSAKCLGGYEWQVQACLDGNCKDIGGTGPKWTFTLTQETNTGNDTIFGSGFVVCGKRSDNPDTAWNERDPCQIAHLFILVKVIFEFFLLRFSVIVLVILTLITGVVFYWPFDKLDIADVGGKIQSAETITKVKDLWRAAGIGYLIIFFGWLLVAIILSVFGYQLGAWWQIKS